MAEPHPRVVPYLQVVRGDATPQEIAALVATLAAIAAARDAATVAPEPARGDWNAPARRLRAPLFPSANGWRRSSLP